MIVTSEKFDRWFWRLVKLGAFMTAGMYAYNWVLLHYEILQFVAHRAF